MRYFLFILSFLFMMPFGMAQAADKAEGEGGKDGPVFVEIDQIVVPIIKKNGKTGVLSLRLIAEVAGEDEKAELSHYIPRLKDAYIRSLYGDVVTKQLTTEEGMLDIASLKSRLVKTSNYVLKEPLVKDILFDKMAQHTF